MENRLKYRKLITNPKFTTFSPDDDHVVFIKRADYNDIDIYYVIVEDAHRTPTADILNADDIFERFGITKEELFDV